MRRSISDSRLTHFLLDFEEMSLIGIGRSHTSSLLESNRMEQHLSLIAYPLYGGEEKKKEEEEEKKLDETKIFFSFFIDVVVVVVSSPLSSC